MDWYSRDLLIDSNNKFNFMNKIYIILTVVLFCSCKKEVITDGYNTSIQKPLYVKTSDIDIVTTNFAIVGADSVHQGGSFLTKKGVVWSKSNMPTIDDNYADYGGLVESIGGYSFELNYLDNNTKYYLRAFAENAGGITYGDQVEFTTYDQVVPPPCSPDSNHVEYDVIGVSDIDFYGISAGTSNYIASYEIAGVGIGGDFDIYFQQAPESGLYKTHSSNNYFEDDECVVIANIGNSLKTALSGDYIYVEKLGEDSYNVTFCNLRFYYSSSLTINAEGNLRVY